MDKGLLRLLSELQPATQETAVWGASELSVDCYISDRRPPDRLITSVRGIVLRGESVLVVVEAEDHYHVVPGGRREKQESLEKLQVKKKESTTVSDIMLYMNYIQQLSKDIEDQAMNVHKTAKLVDQKRHELVAIMQKHETLKKLKYREQQVYQQKLMQSERKLMDELASIRHARKI